MHFSTTGHSGDPVAARYQIAAIPFWVLLITKIPWTNFWRRVLVVLFVISSFTMLSISAVSPVLLTRQENPLFTWVFPKFLTGSFPAYYLPIRLHSNLPNWEQIKPYSVWNLGNLFGLESGFSLLPLFLIALFFILMLRSAIESK